MSCIAGERLAAYWLDELDEADAALLEEHVFGCDACADAYSKARAVIAGVRATLPPVITSARLRELQADTPSLKQVEVPPGGSAVVEFGAGEALFALHLQADLARAERVDFSVEAKDGGPTLYEQTGAPFDAQSGTVIVLCQRHFVSSGRPTLVNMRLRVLRDGRWSESGPYTIDHVFSL